MSLQFLKRFLSLGGNSAQPARNQPAPEPRKQSVPDVSSTDVKRIVERDFKYDFTAVITILDDLGTDTQDPGVARIQLAALKLANGSVEKLRANIEAAKRDYRDILSAAEYPEYGKKGYGVVALPEDERLRITDRDWKQYQDWLRK